MTGYSARTDNAILLQEEAIYKRQEKRKKNLYLRNKRILMNTYASSAQNYNSIIEF